MAKPKRPSLRLYVLGRPTASPDAPVLTMMGEAGANRALMRLPLDGKRFSALQAHVGQLRGFIESNFPKEYDEPQLQDLGSELFDFLIQGDVRDLYNQALGGRQGLLPLELLVEDYELAGWPWEYLYNKARREFICQEFCPISRGMFTWRSNPPGTRRRKKVRILMIVGVLPNDPEARPEEQIKWIREIFATHLAVDSIDLQILAHPRAMDVQVELRRSNYDIIHFFGHAGFDPQRREGYLKLQTPGGNSFQFTADRFSQLLAERNIQFVFLNACETARSDPGKDPARSSLAAALLSRGIPAVVASQFSIPDVSAHYLAAMMYNHLILGHPVIDAIREARLSMSFAEGCKFFDWGIPVLYCIEPDMMVFPHTGRGPLPQWAASGGMSEGKGVLEALAHAKPGGPSVVSAVTAKSPHAEGAKVQIALVDIDSKVGFLPDMAAKANSVQNWAQFKVIYVPVPGASFGEGSVGPTLYLPRMQSYLSQLPEQLGVDRVYALTGCLVDDGKVDDLFAAQADRQGRVGVVSTFGMRKYAADAGVSFPKSCLFLVLALIIARDGNLQFHEETEGCPMDYCDNRDDVVVGLKRMRFDHEPCRSALRDQEELAAIDSLLATDL